MYGSQLSAKELTSRYNWLFSKILITSIFWKTGEEVIEFSNSIQD